MGDAEVDGGCGRIIRIHGEAHAQKLDVSFDEQGAVNVDLALRIRLSADIQADSCTTLGALQ